MKGKMKRKREAAEAALAPEVDPIRGPKQHDPWERQALRARAEVGRLREAILRRKRMESTRRRREKLARDLRASLPGRPDFVERANVCARGFFARLWWALGVAWTGAFRWQRKQELSNA